MVGRRAGGRKGGKMRVGRRVRFVCDDSFFSPLSLFFPFLPFLMWMANQCLVLDPPFPFFAFQQQSASSFISRHRTMSLSLSLKRPARLFNDIILELAWRWKRSKSFQLSPMLKRAGGREKGSELSFPSFLKKKGGGEGKKEKDYDNIIYKRRL